MTDDPILSYTDPSVLPDFTPAPMQRTRHDGWTPERQRRFVAGLGATGSVEAAARMAGISRKSAYALRKRPEAHDFARAWDLAISTGRHRMYDYMFDRAINGVTTIQIKMGGAVEIGHGMDRHLVATQLKVPLPGQDTFKPKRHALSEVER